MARAALVGAATTGITGLAALTRSKVTALNLGVAGVGLIAEVQQLLQLLSVPAAALGGAALTRWLVDARTRGGADELRLTTRTAAGVTLSFTALAGAALVGVAPAVLSLPFEEFGSALALASAASIGSASLGIYAQALIVHGTIGRANIATTLNIALGAALTIVTTPWLGVTGFFLGQLLSAFIAIPVCVFLLRSTIATGNWAPSPRLELDYVKAAIRFGGAGLASAMAGQLALSSIRLTLLRLGGHELNGLFQAAWALDSLLMASITSGLASYFFPRFAAASTPEALQHEVDRAGEFTLLFGGPLILAFGALRHLIISIAYSESFAGASGLLSVLAVADTLKVLGWVAAGPLLYRNQVRAFVVADVTAALVLAAVCQLTVTTQGLPGIGYAQVAAYAVYLPLCAWLLWKLLAVRMRPIVVLRGVALAAAVTLMTTFAQSLVAWLAATALALPAVFGGSGYTAARRFFERTVLARR